MISADGWAAAAALPGWVWVMFGAAALIGLIALGRPRSVRTDPQRLFDAAQRAESRRRCGGRCEHKPMLWRRCDGRAEHADHIYPWSRGGATITQNCQYLCARHNTRKSDRVPSRMYIWRLQRRRRRYFPPGTPTTVQWRIGWPVRPAR